jgi:hypothetical protein
LNKERAGERRDESKRAKEQENRRAKIKKEPSDTWL